MVHGLSCAALCSSFALVKTIHRATTRTRPSRLTGLSCGIKQNSSNEYINARLNVPRLINGPTLLRTLLFSVLLPAFSVEISLWKKI